MVITRLQETLGSGQFGMVNRGVWDHNGSSHQVAVKMLREGSTEEEMVKFLQEATIMGQFHHPNVIQLYGVVTSGPPVSTVSNQNVILPLQYCKCNYIYMYFVMRKK